MKIDQSRFEMRWRGSNSTSTATRPSISAASRVRTHGLVDTLQSGRQSESLPNMEMDSEIASNSSDSLLLVFCLFSRSS